ncbi:MAG TPA: hypothetical protein VFV38_47605 [Ktedonobacteraceae bacterium]|nr:hypothetical protein [Ktedonobacteraceae bacterium]
MSYKDVPHAAVNELMKWVHEQGKQVVSLHTWPHLACWSPPSDWSAHINVHSTPLHARIKRKGYKFTVVYEPDDSLCPVCAASAASVMVFANAAVEALEPAVVAR